MKDRNLSSKTKEECLMQDNPLVSVIIPLYNGKQYIYEAVNSMLNQTYQNIEIIIIDDGSTDEGGTVVNNIDSPKIIYIMNEKNIGVSASRNKGLDLAKGTYIALMDADDISMPTRIEKQVSFLENNTEYGVVSGHYEQFKKRRFSTKIRIEKLPIDPDIIHANILFSSVLCTPATMIRGDVLKNNNLKFDTSLQMAEDFDLWKKLSFVTKIMNLDEVLLRYRRHGNNSVNKISVLYRDYTKVIIRSFDHFNLDIRELFNEEYKLKDIQSFVSLHQYVELILDQNTQSKEYDPIHLKMAAAKFLKLIYNMHIDIFGYKLYTEFEKLPLFEFVPLANKEKRKLFFKSLF